jgi:hypothetical protein
MNSVIGTVDDSLDGVPEGAGVVVLLLVNLVILTFITAKEFFAVGHT